MEDADGRRARWWAALRRTPVAVWDDDVTDWAAALTYYAVLALFPVLLVILSIVGLTVPTAKPEVIDRLSQAAPVASRALLRSTLVEVAGQPSTAWTLIFVAGAGALWSGSSYLSVFRRALHAMHRISADRPVWRTAPRIIATALVLISLLLTTTLAMFLTGGLARRLGRALHLGTGPQVAWDALRWPLVALVAVALVLVLYRSGPRPSRPVRRMAPGGALAVLLLLAVSLGFAFYTSHVTTYHRLYGSLAGVVVFLVWLWLSNLALLVGAQFNAELAKPARRKGADRPSPAP
ncbi:MULTISPECIES: YihY/virulence factor BrkB family protein [unclassified Streptomyces]|uniref:YihY/virulence factor BrkB family protein n=1 Tax=unclassified Streptomyces TaxID=2593676 RepID=UPI00055C2017|nr:MULTISPECIES: YihY/virulence factor BrkB family protein [unclassified Streptomyces]KOX02858.1 ribonuclease BN [Streptomyces sp. NRRL B-3648]